MYVQNMKNHYLKKCTNIVTDILNVLLTEKLREVAGYKANNVGLMYKEQINKNKILTTSGGDLSTAYWPCSLKNLVRCTTKHLNKNFLKVSA